MTIKCNKDFLSEVIEEGSSITWKVNDSPSWTTDKDEVKGKDIEAYVEIRDCNTKISLDFYLNSEANFRTRAQRLQKLDKLINELQDFRTAFIELTDSVEYYEGYNKESR